MKKSSILFAGVAALALSATAASAQSVNLNQGGQSHGVTIANHNLSGHIGSVSIITPDATATQTPNAAGPGFSNAQNANAAQSQWHYVSVVAQSVGGAGNLSDKADFSLTGKVAKDCAFYTGSSNALAFDFGQIGIYTTDNAGPTAAFTMVAPAVLQFNTNLAGCNTPNTITIAKSDVRGLVNNSGAGYDTNVFQANLPYEINASYKAAAGTGTGAGVNRNLLVDVDTPSNTVSHGAWKSPLGLKVTVKQPPKALLAGDYAGGFTVTIAAN